MFENLCVNIYPMENPGLEIILSRQLAECLSTAMFITDPSGNLLYYNETAEEILGRRYDDTGSMSAAEWSTIFTPLLENGSPMPPERLPLMQTLTNQRPAHGSFYIISLTGEKHFITVTSFPITAIDGIFTGAIALFWIQKHGN